MEEKCHQNAFIAGADSPLQQQRQTDSDKLQVGECLFLQVYILVHLQSQVSLTLCTIRMKNNLSKCGPSACWTANKNLADNVGGCDTADLHNPQRSPNPAVRALKLLNI